MVKRLSPQEIEDLAYRATRAAGFTQDVSHCLADVTMQAEVHGKHPVGLSHLFNYFDAAKDNLLNRAPKVQYTSTTPSMLVTDADDGPMQYAFLQSEDAFVTTTKTHGIAVLMVTNAFPAGALGYYARRLATHGIASINAVNSPAVMSFGGSTERLLGTNPLSYGVPFSSEQAVIVDQASSSTALVNVQQAAQAGTHLPEGWAIDAEGQITTDPAEALGGALLPFGKYKGGNIAMMVELLAMMSGAKTSREAAELGLSNEHPRVGATFIGIDTQKLPGYTERVAQVMQEFRGLGSDMRLVRDTRDQPQYVDVADQTYNALNRFIRAQGT